MLRPLLSRKTRSTNTSCDAERIEEGDCSGAGCCDWLWAANFRLANRTSVASKSRRLVMETSANTDSALNRYCSTGRTISSSSLSEVIFQFAGGGACAAHLFVGC